jgi:hypothetical protein
MAVVALTGEEVEGFDASFATRPEWAAALDDALAAAPPVEEAYFNSFTGRLETLVYAAEILVELQRRRSETH